MWEWVEDCDHEDYKGAPTDGSAWKKEDGGNCYTRVFRGGAWNYAPRGVRSSFRGRGDPESEAPPSVFASSGDGIGFPSEGVPIVQDVPAVQPSILKPFRPSRGSEFQVQRSLDGQRFQKFAVLCRFHVDIPVNAKVQVRWVGSSMPILQHDYRVIPNRRGQLRLGPVREPI